MGVCAARCARRAPRWREASTTCIATRRDCSSAFSYLPNSVFVSHLQCPYPLSCWLCVAVRAVGKQPSQRRWQANWEGVAISTPFRLIQLSVSSTASTTFAKDECVGKKCGNEMCGSKVVCWHIGAFRPRFSVSKSVMVTSMQFNGH